MSSEGSTKLVAHLVAEGPAGQVRRLVAGVVELDPLTSRVVDTLRVDHQLVDDDVGSPNGQRRRAGVDRTRRLQCTANAKMDPASRRHMDQVSARPLPP